MRRALTIAGTALAALLAYLTLWPVPIDPVPWHAPADRGLVDPFGPDDRLAAATAIELGNHTGPEDVTAGHDGHLYATTADGAILEIDGSGNVRQFAAVGGRPLGIETAADGSLICANAFIGLQRIAPDGSVEVLADEVDGEPLVYANDLAIAADGSVYFSESSTRFGAAVYRGTYGAARLDLLEHGAHGRILRFDPATGDSRIVLDGLHYANGVAISEDQHFLLIAETGSYRILRLWLEGPDAGSVETVLDNLPGFPDNINNGPNGRFWIGLVAPRSHTLDALSDRPFLRKVVQRLPAFLRPRVAPSSHVIAITGDGEVLMNLQDPDARYSALTGVFETRRALYLTSLEGSELAVLDKQDL